LPCRSTRRTATRSRHPVTSQSADSAVTLNCYYWGTPAGPYGNTLWYEAETDTQFPIDGLINDHYLNTPDTAANSQPQTAHCPFGAGTGMGLAYPYGNILWYLGEDITNDTYGWINDHYLSTPGTAANPQPQTGSCGL
jgi:hypothetical protein